MDFDDGFVAWINGVEVARSNLGATGSSLLITLRPPIMKP